MSEPTPTLDQAFGAVVTALQGASVGTVYGYENRLPTEAEMLRELESAATDYAVDLWLVSATVRAQEGPAVGERYSLYRFECRYLCVRRGEEETSLDAHVVAERARTAIEANPAIFQIGGQYPLYTDETVEQEGRFVDRENSRYFETILRFTVEARRWA